MAITATWQSPAARDARRAVFAAARRRTRLVRVLRYLLPLFAAVSVVAFIVITRFYLPLGLDFDAARLSVTRNSIIMDSPHLSGFDRHQREFSMTATRAIQPFTNPSQVRLENLQASIETATGDVTRITAESGDYDHNKRTLQLFGAIAADSDDGYTMHLTDADIDLAAGTLVSENPVTIGYGGNSFSGKRLSVSDGGKVIVLEGDVKSTLMPPKRDAAGAGAGAGAE